MGSVGNFLFGGSKNKQSQQQSSENSSTQQSQNSSKQASASVSNQFQNSGSQGYNQAYAPIAAALSPALGYTTQAGDTMAALLGLTPNTFSYQPTNFNPAASPLPPASAVPTPKTPNLNTLLQQIASAPTVSPVQQPASTPLPTGQVSGPTTGSTGGTSSTGASIRDLPISIGMMDRRETGGPVTAGTPYVVGEKQPEVFVPEQNGTILPRVPMGMDSLIGRQGRRNRNTGIVPPLPTPSPTTTPTPTPTPAPQPVTVSTQVNPAVNASSALNNYANSAGLGFVLDQGQKALSGASAANGVFNSGATGKALVQYGQNLGNTYLDQYMQRLNQYGQLGLGAASALTGAGGVNQSQSVGGGGSSSVSAGSSQGTSSGSSYGTSQGTGSGSGSSKKGVLPTILGS